MKFTKFLIISASLILFTPTMVEAQVNIQTGKTRIQTDSGGVNISTDGVNINTNDDKIFLDIDDDYNYTDRNLSRPLDWSRYRYQRAIPERGQITKTGTTCSQQSTQSTTINGSNRQVNQSNVSHCN